jgi:phenylalanyl-tRNA synthetase beta chain
LVNPATEDGAVMRSALLPGLLKNLKHNSNFGNSDLKLFELRPVFSPQPGGGLPSQRFHLAALLAGNVAPVAWTEPGRIADFFDIKGVLESLLAGLKITAVTFASETVPYLHPGQTAALGGDGEALGFAGRLHPDLARIWGFSSDPIVFELDIDALHKLSKSQTKYAKESRFPPVLRDLAVVVDEAVEAGRVLDEIRGAVSEILREVSLFDVYRGPGMEMGKKSLAFSLRYQVMDRSLTDAEVGEVHEAIVRRLAETVGARLRS